ncbi:MAG: TMEM175 family protein [Vogesella sp.]|uniref:TMEM175 family protein n=1 Tax=Vogesella sp. TaxID=1904252 RepID=UPI00391CEF5A
MGKNRLEAFSDGVLAIIITIMVLELKVPHSIEWAALLKLWPVFVSYLLSFIYVGIYWNNHHHMLHASRQVSGVVLWANLHLLFWLSLIPFASGWMGENHFAPLTTALYGFVLLMSALAYWLLEWALSRVPQNALLSQALGRDVKGKLSLVLYLLGILVAMQLPALAWGIYAAVALMWLVPDRRIERQLRDA